MIGRILFFITFVVTVLISIIPVFVSMLIWVFTKKGLMWIVRIIDFMLSKYNINYGST